MSDCLGKKLPFIPRELIECMMEYRVGEFTKSLRYQLSVQDLLQRFIENSTMGTMWTIVGQVLGDKNKEKK